MMTAYSLNDLSVPSGTDSPGGQTSSRALSARIIRIDSLSPTLKRFTFVPAHGTDFPVAAPGAHVVVTIPGAARQHRNAYSLISPVGETGAYQIVIRRVDDSRGGSHWMHDRAQPGMEFSISWPASLFPLSNIARHHLLISGGIGLTPLLSHMHALRSRGATFALHHVCRSEDKAAFKDLLAPFQGCDITLHVSDDASTPRLDLHGLLSIQKLGTVLYTCGPRVLMDAIEAAGKHLGWPEDSIRMESFGGQRGGMPFTVIAHRSGQRIHVSEDMTILEALEDAGVNPPNLCRGGACGQCLTHVVDGTPEHRDDFLTEEERASNRRIMICVSRARCTELTLDI